MGFKPVAAVGTRLGVEGDLEGFLGAGDVLLRRGVGVQARIDQGAIVIDAQSAEPASTYDLHVPAAKVAVGEVGRFDNARLSGRMLLLNMDVYALTPPPALTDAANCWIARVKGVTSGLQDLKLSVPAQKAFSWSGQELAEIGRYTGADNGADSFTTRAATATAMKLTGQGTITSIGIFSKPGGGIPAAAGQFIRAHIWSRDRQVLAQSVPDGSTWPADTLKYFPLFESLTLAQDVPVWVGWQLVDANGVPRGPAGGNTAPGRTTAVTKTGTIYAPFDLNPTAGGTAYRHITTSHEFPLASPDLRTIPWGAGAQGFMGFQGRIERIVLVGSPGSVALTGDASIELATIGVPPGVAPGDLNIHFDIAQGA